MLEPSACVLCCQPFGSVSCFHPHGRIIITNFEISIFFFQHPIWFYLSFPLVFLLARPFETAETGCTWAHIVDIRNVVPERTIWFCSGGVERFLIRSTRLALLPHFVAGWCGVSHEACRIQGDHYMVATGCGTDRQLQWTWRRPTAIIDIGQTDRYCGH